MNSLRRSRLLAVLLLAASPALLGTVLPVVHPCPVDAPWLEHQATGQSAQSHHHDEASDTPRESHEHQSCSCIGSWLSGTAVAPPLPAEIRIAATLAVPVLVPAHDSSLDLGPIAALLPPATAPPLG